MNNPPQTKVISVNHSVSYVVISPVRNEAKHIGLTIDSMVNQTIRPLLWIIVNDGSSDETHQIAISAAQEHSWIQVVDRADRGFRQAGGGVVDAFYDGYGSAETLPWDYIVKLDGDLSFEPDYFAKCFGSFSKDQRLGIAGGTVCCVKSGHLEPEAKDDPRFHVRGATKIYRADCWKAIGGLLRSPGWDTLDEVKANMLGWTTQTIPNLNVIHHRPTGAAYGTWSDRTKNGRGCYISGYHPLFMLLKCVRRMADKPYIVAGCGLLYGFGQGYMKKIPRVQDQTLIKYFRGQQMNRLFRRKSLWD